MDFLPLDVDLERVGKCNVQLGHPDRGSGSCSRGRRKCSGLALDCGKQKPFAGIFIHHQNWKQLIVSKTNLLTRQRKSWKTKGKSCTVEPKRMCQVLQFYFIQAFIMKPTARLTDCLILTQIPCLQSFKHEEVLVLNVFTGNDHSFSKTKLTKDGTSLVNKSQKSLAALNCIGFIQSKPSQTLTWSCLRKLYIQFMIQK